jgi:lipoate-protein ligase B
MTQNALTGNRIETLDLGTAGYREVYKIQRKVLAYRKAGRIPDSVIILEHTPVFTIGRAGSTDDLHVNAEKLVTKDIDVVMTDRGGRITFHGPGQLVLYPILDLKDRGRDLRRYIRMLEEVMLDYLEGYSIAGRRVEGRSGVWIDDNRKIGSIGVGISNWVTYHGLSVNVNTDLEYFEMVDPCGIKNCSMVSVASLLGRNVPIGQARRRLIKSFMKIFEAEEVFRS